MASYLPDLSRDNISLYTIPAAFLIALAPRFYAASTYKAATNKSMNTRAPRDFIHQITSDPALDTTTRGRLLRAEAAQANNFENLGLFAAAVVAGTAAGLSPSTVNGCSLGYLAARFAYNHIYIFNDLVPPVLRTGAYFAGMGCVFALFVQAGWKVNGSVVS